MQTSLGDIDIQLMDSAAPATVANFLGYVTSAAYVNSFIHRSVPGFIVQGGGYRWNNTSNTYSGVPANAPVINEFSPARSNLRGTIAMAKIGSDPNSATNQWFFNLADNSANLDFQNGGFTVFGQVIGNGMQVVDAIAALPRVNAGAPFDTLPLISVPAGAITAQNLVIIGSVTVLDAQAPAVPAGLTATATGSSQIDLAWTAATDNVAVTAYHVYRGGTLIATLGNVTSYGDTGLAASTTYTYTVAACDASGNCSAPSLPASAPTHALPVLTVSTAGPGSVTGTGISCGSDCTEAFTSGTVTTLSAELPNFSSWNGCDSTSGPSGSVCTVSMSSNRTVLATFVVPDPILTVGKTGRGTVTGSAGGISCGASCSASIPNSQSVTLTASADSGSVISAWTGACAGVGTGVGDASGTCTLTMNGAQSAGANFQYSSGQVQALNSGWNLIGNPTASAIDVADWLGDQANPVSGVTPYVITVWRWRVDPSGACSTGCWEVYAPQQGTRTKAQAAADAIAAGIAPLTSIPAGQGFWVRRSTAPGLNASINLPPLPGAPFYYDPTHFGPTSTSPSLKKNTWHLISHYGSVSPAMFNSSEINANPPAPYSVPTNLFETMWVWGNMPSKQNWYYFKPATQQAGIDACIAAGASCSGLEAMSTEAQSLGLLDFTNDGKTLGPNTGFWVRR